MNKKVILIIVGLLLMLLAVLAGGVYLKTKDLLHTAPVVVTVQDIPEQTAIRPEMVKVIEIPEKFIPPNAVRDLKELEGKWTMAGSGLSKNSFLFKGNLANEDDVLAALMSKTDNKERLVSIPVDLPSSLGGKVARGDVVELWFTYKGNQKTPPYAGRLLNQVEVIALQDTQGKDVVQGAAPQNPQEKSMLDSVMPAGIASSIGSVSSVPRIMTIMVPEDMVEYILLAQSKGKLVVVGKAGFEPNQPVIGEAKQWLVEKVKGGNQS